MKDPSKTNAELIEEISVLKQRIRELEKSEAESKQVEAALWESEEKYRVLFDGINDAVFLHDMDDEGLPGRFLQANDVACRRLGYTREELLSLTPRDITMPEEYERIADKRMGIASHGDILVETIHVTKDGLNIPVESNIRKFQYFNRQVALSISRDITDRKQAEEERERLIAELQKALSEVKKLSGLLPICASCKKIRDDKGYWNQIESYIRDRSEAEFSHGICPDCAKELYPELIYEKEQVDEKG
jgi:PAS domain S-box-containing protein